MIGQLFNAEDLQKSDFLLGKTQFKIQKLNALDGFRIFDKIRAELGDNLHQLDIENADAVSVIVALLRLVMSTSTEFMNEIRVAFYSEILFRRKGDTDYQPMNIHNEASAFEHFDPLEIYEFLLRCFVINFFSSFQKIKKIFEKMKEEDKGKKDTKLEKQN